MKRYVKEFANYLLKDYNRVLLLNVNEEVIESFTEKKNQVEKILNGTEKGFYTDCEAMEMLVDTYAE